jgi:F-type H+-transporting ATPase subunit b
MFRNTLLLGTLLKASAAAGVVLLPALLLGAEDAGEKTPGVYVSQFLWAIGSFVVVLLILIKKLLPPITAALDKRAADIRDALAVADKAGAEAQAMISKHEAQLETARAEAAAIIEEGKADALKVKDSIVSSARVEVEELQARSRSEIEQAKTAAVDELDRRAVAISVDIAGKLLGKSINPAEHQELIQERLRALQEA